MKARIVVLFFNSPFVSSILCLTSSMTVTSVRRRLLSHTQLVCFLTRSKRNTGIDTQWMLLAACIYGHAQRRHGRSWDETKYRPWIYLILFSLWICPSQAHHLLSSICPVVTPTVILRSDLIADSLSRILCPVCKVSNVPPRTTWP